MKVLLIDDSTMSRNILKRALGEDHEYVEAGEGMRGLEMYFTEKPDLVFLDLTMPGVSGMEILNQLRQIDQDARIIISTADIQDFSRQQASDLGASAYLTKPFTVDGVQEAVRQAMEARSSSTGPERPGDK
jgi:two-component system, chemotaxis family, chemotaxis protein CheY